MVHSVTKQVPNDARKKENEFESKLNMSIEAKKRKTYPELEVGVKVKVARKKGIAEKKRTSHFLKGNFSVKDIATRLGQKK